MARKILLADDSVTAQNMGRKILADAGYEVITVNNGSAALKKIAEQKPDLILLDVYMPGYSGLEVCQRLKEAQETARVPVLLTVGKLEPFKPEEAKRARADGFIVKPFEASELLSALSKLEDKIVPRPESSKPGRFARANAALDEARYDKNAAAEEDSGWKDRIGFPKKKAKTEAPPEETDDSSFYNPMNKDLRTVVERRPDPPHAARHQAKVAEDNRVDLGALAPEGLPKDVTPEEIAALAAAAARVKGTIAETRVGEEKIAEANVVEAKAVETKIVETKIADNKFVEPVVAEAKLEPKVEATEATPPAVEVPQEVAAPVATFAEQKSEEKIEAKTEAKIEEKFEEKPEEKIATAGKSSDATPEAGSIASPSHDDLMAAIAALEPDPVTSAGAGSGNGSWLREAADSNADEPVTMAVAAAAAAGLASVSSRWTAVAVALAPEEAAISLELEMEKASAALAAAATVPAPVVTPIAEVQPQPQEVQPQEAQLQETQPVAAPSAPVLEASTPAEGVVSQPVVPVASPEPDPEPDAAQTARTVDDAAVANDGGTSVAVSNAAAEAISEAVKELEAVAAAYAEQIRPAAPALEPAPVEDFKVTSAPHVPAAGAETHTEDSAAVQSPVTQSIESPATAPAALEVPKVDSAQPDTLLFVHAEPSQPEIEAAKIEAPKNDEVKSEVPAPAVAAVTAKEETPAAAAETTAAMPETAPTQTTPTQTTPALVNEVPAESVSAKQDSSHAVSSSMISSESEVVSSNVISSDMAAALGKLAAGGIFDMAKKESEIAATTAAAWASWRRIRETGDAKGAPGPAPEPNEKEEAAASDPQDAAAMAVAAGAEKAPEAAHAGEPESDDIAGIVDSVLADLRPKIVEEISRKMGKKK